MSFDASRFPFDAWKDFNGVVMQQGRVQIDSDWNEWLAILNRRIQAGTLDTMGAAVVPSTTPNGFLISATQTGTTNAITIGPGRMYVDGLLVENHGPFGSATFDPALAELSNTPQVLPLNAPQAPLDFGAQPYLPGASLPASTTGPFFSGNGPFIVYLDVWQRDVTYLQAPDLVEKAVGVDTTGRLQTVWQVKMLDVSKVAPASGMTCGTDVAPWDTLILPSASRLTTGVFPSTSPPTNIGYTGMENQLYRVEIHQTGSFNAAATGTGATFKWSRDNASVATALTAIAAYGAASQLTVQSTGKDAVLSFQPGDWIEITDDSRELAGKPGDLMQIAPGGVDPAARTITLTAAVSTDIATNLTTPPANLINCHARIQRWDSTNANVYLVSGTTTTLWIAAGSRGDIPVPPKGQALILENGVTVAFDLAPATGSFTTGDYWCFAARSSDGSVGPLKEAPPLGVHHHYARLAVVTFGTKPQDCRNPWPPVTSKGDSCCCTVCVEQAEYLANNAAITNAINKVKAAGGGRVCLGPGTFVLPSALSLDSLENVTLSGQGPVTVLAYQGTGPAISVTMGWNVQIEDLTVTALYAPATAGSGVIAGVFVQNCLGFALERCAVLTVDTGTPVVPASPAFGAGAFTLGTAPDPFKALDTASQAATGTGIGVVLDGFLVQGVFRENLLVGDIGIGSSASVNLSQANPLKGTRTLLLLDGIDISRNTLDCTMAGVAIGMTDTVTHECFFLGPTDIAGNRVQISQLMGIALAGLSLPDAIVRVDGNYVEAPLVGILSLVDGALIADNLVAQPVVASPTLHDPSAIGIGAAGPIEITTVYARASVLRNRVQNWAGRGIGASHLALGTVQDNSVTNVLIDGIVAVGNVELRVCGNEVIGVSIPAGSTPDITGIDIGPAVNAVVEGNTVSVIAAAGGVNAFGIHLVGTFTASVDGNQVNQIGPVNSTAQAAYGIRIDAAVAQSLSGNAVLQFGTAATASSFYQGLVIGGAPGSSTPTPLSSASVRDNNVAGGSLLSLIQIEVATDCIVTANSCYQTGTPVIPKVSTPIVVIAGATAIVGNNRISGAGHDTGLAVDVPAFAPPTPVTITGNLVTTGSTTTAPSILLNGLALPTPWAALNIVQ